jgi:hypothetical protein
MVGMLEKMVNNLWVLGDQIGSGEDRVQKRFACTRRVRGEVVVQVAFRLAAWSRGRLRRGRNA